MQEPLPAEDEHPLTLEDILLGGLLRGFVEQPEVAKAAVAMLRPRHFGSESNRVVFEAVTAIHWAGRRRVDLVSIFDRLQQFEQWDKAGGAARLAELWFEACDPTWVPELAEAFIQRLPQELVQEPESSCELQDIDTSFDFGANAPGAEQLKDGPGCRW